MKNPLLFNYGIDALTTGSALAIARGKLKAELNNQAGKASVKSKASKLAAALMYHIIDSWK